MSDPKTPEGTEKASQPASGAKASSAPNARASSVQIEDAPPSRRMSQKRKSALMVVAAVVVVAGLAWFAYDWLVLSHYEETDNADGQGNVIQITPQVGGTVTAVYADETDLVQAGQTLVRLDPADVDVAQAQAEAALGQTVRQARALYANNATYTAQIKLREADADKARTQLATAQQDLTRRQDLASGGAVSREELEHARSQVTAAQSALAAAQAAVVAAREQLASNQTLTDGAEVEQHPSVLAAAAKLREAWIAARRMTLPAPVNGYVGKRVVQLGQRVAPGAPLMTVVPLDQVWVDANFKENQLRDIRVGQPASLTADLYGGKVVYTGTIVGLGIATGAASALLPAQNATGNWIKVVQRVPVRIRLDPKPLAEHPLRVGLSMLVKVDIDDQSGPRLAAAPRAEPVAQTQAFALDAAGAETLIRNIVARNMGRPVPAAPAASAPRHPA
jgi:membrane fusion protein (multidrug efflux system)